MIDLWIHSSLFSEVTMWSQKQTQYRMITNKSTLYEAHNLFFTSHWKTTYSKTVIQHSIHCSTVLHVISADDAEQVAYEYRLVPYSTYRSFIDAQ
jgi:hypothetical protein